MSGVVKRAERAVIDVERITATGVDLYNHGLGLGHERASRLAPELAGITYRHLVEGASDFVHVAIEGRWLHPRIARRKTAADIDDIHHRRCAHDLLRNRPQNLTVADRAHHLRACMERDPKHVSSLTRTPDQTGCLVPRRAKFTLQRN